MELTSPPRSYYSFGQAKSSRSLSVSAATLLRRSSASVFPTSTRPKTPNSKHSLKPTKTLAPALSTSTPDTVTTPCPPKNKKVLVPIGLGTEEMEAVILVDVLRRAGAQVILASVEQQLEVEASGGTILVADTSICSCSDEVFDLIALPGGMPGAARLRDSELLQKITRKQAEEKRLYSAICAAPAITLLPWGLIRRKRTTCHPAFVDKLPTFWAVKSDIQVSGELTTSRGPGTALRFAISLVDQLFGESIAKEIGDLLLVSAADDIPKKEEFNEVQWSLDHTPNVLIPIANGSEEIEVVTVVDILRRAKANVMIASIEKSLQILASQGTKIVADKLLPAAAETVYDLIILPGGYAGSERLRKSRVLKGLLKEQVTGERMVGAMCSSTEILRKQGLMKDKKKAAAHNSVMSKIHDTVDDAQVVIDGRLITSKGFGTSIFFGLTIVDKLFGHARARSVAEGLVFKYPRS